MGAIVHPTGGLNSRSLRDFQPRIGFAYHPLNKWVFRGGFGINTVDIRFPNALQQFDEYQAQVVQQRAPGIPTPLFQLSQGPATVHITYSPTNPLSTLVQTTDCGPVLDGRQSASRLRDELELDGGIPGQSATTC